MILDIALGVILAALPLSIAFIGVCIVLETAPYPQPKAVSDGVGYSVILVALLMVAGLSAWRFL